jgi:DNA primase
MPARIDTAALKREHSVADVIARYGVELHPSGASLVGRCPFHDDGGRPNLYVYQHSQSWFCYRCNVGGDAIRFVERIERVAFRDAVERIRLASPTHVVSARPLSNPRGGRPPRSPARLPAPGAVELASLSAAVTFYHQRLLATPAALAYLVQRGLTRETIAAHRLGYVPGEGLTAELRRRGLPLTAASRLGLLSPGGRERLAGRVVIPELRRQEPIWLIGRLIEPNGARPKYFGLPGPKPLLGREAASAEPVVWVTEGVVDWLVLRQWGLPALALVGTHIRPDQLAALRRFRQLLLVLDNDAAGRAATAHLVAALGPRALAVDLPSVKDVADLAVLPDGRDRLLRALSAHPLVSAA